MSRETVEFAYDLHAGLSSVQVPDFDQLPLIGMAATLAIHLKGLGEVPYELLRRVSDHFMSIPSLALPPVLNLLAEVEFVRLMTRGKTILSVIPEIPIFDNVYEGISGYVENEINLNGYEQATLAILQSLYTSPRNRDALFNQIGIEKKVFDRCLMVGSRSGILTEITARGKNILVSPHYFADNLVGLADIVAAAGAPALEATLSKLKSNQGWPISLVAKTGEIGGTKLSLTEATLLQKLASEGIVKPPTIKFGQTSEAFLFTPRPGSMRLNGTNREIYERSMALISAVRKGQLLPNAFSIRSPVRILETLRDVGYLKSNSEARDQYHNLVVMRVANLRQTTTNRWQLHLHRTEENEAALALAIELLRSGNMANMEVNQDARIALTKDEEYIQSLVASSDLRKRQSQMMDEQAIYEFEQLILKLD